MIRTIVAYVKAWSTEQKVRVEEDDVASTPFLRLFDERCCDAHNGNKKTCARLRAQYHRTVVHLFGSVESMLEFRVPSSLDAVTRFDPETATLTFVVSEIDPDVGSVQEYLRAGCVVMKDAWQSVSNVIAVIDCSDMTSERARGILAVSNQQDAVHGIRLWSTLPCKYSRIVVIKPSDTPWVRTLVAFGTRMLSAKMRGRLHICTREEADRTLSELRRISPEREQRAFNAES